MSDIEEVPYLGTARCMRCGRTGVKLAFTSAAWMEILKDPLGPTNHLPKMVVDSDGYEHECKIEDIKETVNFKLVE